MIVPKGDQVTKPVIVVKMPCKLLYVIQVKRPYYIDIRVFDITIVASDWPRTFYTVLFKIPLLFVSIHKEVLTRNLI